jgi:LAO/AO transport system kinase
MDAAGRELIVVETVGVGQDEVAVMELAHTVAVVSVPGLGDDIQILKAGILEIADLHVVNKADRDGAGRLLADLRSLSALTSAEEHAWVPPVLSCVATRGDGVEALLATVFEHAAFLRNSRGMEVRCRRIAKSRVLRIAQQLLKDTLAALGEGSEGMVEQVARRELGPYVCARDLLAETAGSAGASRRPTDAFRP